MGGGELSAFKEKKVNAKMGEVDLMKEVGESLKL
jgi:hypothetical protein